VWRALLFVSLAGVGCTGGGLAIGTPADTPSGIYRVTVKTSADDCDPPYAEGEVGDQLVETKRGAGMSVPLPSRGSGTALSWYKIDVRASDGYANQGEASPVCLIGTSLRAQSRYDLQLLGADARTIEFSDIEDWTVPDGCADFAPKHSCHLERTLTYTLVHTCPEPIRISVSPHGEVECE